MILSLKKANLKRKNKDMSTILQDMMGLLKRKKTSNAKNDDFIVAIRYKTAQDYLKPNPEFNEKLIKLNDLKSFIGGGAKSTTTLIDSPTITWNYLSGYNAEVTLTGNRILSEPTNVVDGDYGTLIIVQDGVGSHTLTLPASFKVVNGGAGAITLSTAPGSIDSISWVKIGGDFLVTLGLNFN